MTTSHPLDTDTHPQRTHPPAVATAIGTSTGYDHSGGDDEADDPPPTIRRRHRRWIVEDSDEGSDDCETAHAGVRGPPTGNGGGVGVRGVSRDVHDSRSWSPSRALLLAECGLDSTSGSDEEEEAPPPLH